MQIVNAGLIMTVTVISVLGNPSVLGMVIGTTISKLLTVLRSTNPIGKIMPNVNSKLNVLRTLIKAISRRPKPSRKPRKRRERPQPPSRRLISALLRRNKPNRRQMQPPRNRLRIALLRKPLSSRRPIPQTRKLKQLKKKLKQQSLKPKQPRRGLKSAKLIRLLPSKRPLRKPKPSQKPE